MGLAADLHNSGKSTLAKAAMQQSTTEITNTCYRLAVRVTLTLGMTDTSDPRHFGIETLQTKCQSVQNTLRLWFGQFGTGSETLLKDDDVCLYTVRTLQTLGILALRHFGPLVWTLQY